METHNYVCESAISNHRTNFSHRFRMGMFELHVGESPLQWIDSRSTLRPLLSKVLRVFLVSSLTARLAHIGFKDRKMLIISFVLLHILLERTIHFGVIVRYLTAVQFYFGSVIS
jgi:hypothetical protein